MSESSQITITRMLAQAGAGDARASADLLPLLYDELRLLARDKMRHERPGHTLQPTALVHEAYLRLLGPDDGASGDAANQRPSGLASANRAEWHTRGHFFAAAAEAMRRILIERARRRDAVKHGAGLQRVDIDDLTIASPAPDIDLLRLDEALCAFEQQDQVRSQVVKLRYFAGLTIAQTAEALGISDATVSRHWTFAQAWLYERMSRDHDSSASDA